jgi:hypothetical protein
MRMRIPRAMVFVLWMACLPLDSARAQVSGLTPPPPPPRGPQGQPAPPRDAQPVRRTGTAVVRGRVVDALTGQALPRVRVRLLAGVGGSAALTTESAGTFEFTELPGGKYYIGVSRRGYMNGTFPEPGRSLRRGAGGGLIVAEGQVMDNVTIPLYHGSAISGRLTDAFGDPLDGASVEVVRAPSGQPPQSFSNSGGVNDLGEFRISRLQPGSYYLLAVPRGGGQWGGGPDQQTTAAVPTYYPGVLSIDQAQPILVERGQTVSGMDFPVIEQAVTVITGIVLDSTGQPAIGGNVSVEGTAGWTGGGFGGGGPIKEDGSFELRLAPGDYRLSAFAAPPRSAGDSSQSGTAPRQQQMGMMRLTVGTEPISNVVINAGDGSTISGKIIFDGDAPPVDARKINVGAQGAAANGPGFGPRRANDCRTSNGGKVNADLTFTIDGVRGSCLLTIGVQDSRWQPRSAIYRSTDLLDRPIELANNQAVRDVQVTLTTRRTELSAEVTGDQGESVQDYVLLAFSTDKARRTMHRYLGIGARVSNSMPVGPTGTPPPTNPGALASLRQIRQGIITNLPPGDYFVVALDDLASDDVRDPAFFEPLLAHATRVTLRDGEPQTVQLRRLKLPGSNQ